MFDVPDAVLDALDADDGSKVDAVVNRFLPLTLPGRDGRRANVFGWRRFVATVMHAMPGITRPDAMAMEWCDLIEWWGEARLILEGPEGNNHMTASVAELIIRLKDDASAKAAQVAKSLEELQRQRNTSRRSPARCRSCRPY